LIAAVPGEGPQAETTMSVSSNSAPAQPP